MEDCPEGSPSLLSSETPFCSKFPMSSKQRTLGVYREHETLLEISRPSGESGVITRLCFSLRSHCTKLTSFCLSFLCLFNGRVLGANDVPGTRPKRYNFSSPRAWSLAEAHKGTGHFFQRCFYLKISWTYFLVEWMGKLQDIHTRRYYSMTERNEL